MITKVYAMVLSDRRLKLFEIAMVGISKELTHHILNEELKVKKLSTKWEPRLLTFDQKLTLKIHMQMSQECLDCFQSNTTNFMQRFITTDETLCQTHKQWSEAGTSAPKKASLVKSADKVLVSAF